jgi:hypothetical protein
MRNEKKAHKIFLSILHYLFLYANQAKAFFLPLISLISFFFACCFSLTRVFPFIIMLKASEFLLFKNNLSSPKSFSCLFFSSHSFPTTYNSMFQIETFPFEVHRKKFVFFSLHNLQKHKKVRQNELKLKSFRHSHSYCCSLRMMKDEMRESNFYVMEITSYRYHYVKMSIDN